MGRRTFGSVRKLPSGRYQAAYWNEGQRYAGPTTFSTKADANAYLASVETDVRKRLWISPDASAVTFRTYSDQWMADRTDLRPTTRSLYRILLDKWLLPYVGDVSLGAMTPELWIRWHAKAAAEHPKSLQPGKAYKLAHAVHGPRGCQGGEPRPTDGNGRAGFRNR
jgi:hypothetical protein